MGFKLVLFSYIFLISSPEVGDLHSFYISTCYIKQEGNKLVVDYRMFIDDLQQAFKKNEFIQEGSTYCDTVANYIRNHFAIRVDSNEVELTLKECEIAGEAQLRTVSCKLEGVMNETNNAVISVLSSVLIEEFEDQVNMIHVRLNGVKKSVNLDKGRTSFTL